MAIPPARSTRPVDGIRPTTTATATYWPPRTRAGLALTTAFRTDADGDLTDAFTPLGAHVSYVRDGSGNITSQTDADGNVSSITRDVLGRPTAVTLEADPAHHRRHGQPHLPATRYDARSQVVQTSAPDSGATSYLYDADGHAIRTDQPAGRSTVDSYNSRGDLVSTAAPDGVTTMTYDEVGRILSRKDPTGALTRYDYDALGQRTGQTDPLRDAPHSPSTSRTGLRAAPPRLGRPSPTPTTRPASCSASSTPPPPPPTSPTPTPPTDGGPRSATAPAPRPTPTTPRTG